MVDAPQLVGAKFTVYVEDDIMSCGTERPTKNELVVH